MNLQSCDNLAIEAVPGAGKTHLIVEACKDDVTSLVLAYNRELADGVVAALEQHGLTDRATCTTFHALCGRCLGLARDDQQLLKHVEQAERGVVAPRDVPDVRRIFIDEAQDVRELYVRLLRVLRLTCAQIVVAGDENQLVYDFDPDFPATLTTLKTPHVAFGGSWSRVRLHRSHRLTKPMCVFVNRLFGTCIESDRDGPEVDVRSPVNMYTDLYDAIEDTLDGDDVLLLTDRKRGNRALKNMLNLASRRGKEVHIHGVSSTPDARRRVTCGTFWSAKGLEADTVVVLLPGNAPFNATYVALTRARARLVVVIDRRDPHPLVCCAVAECPSLVRGDDNGVRRMVHASARNVADPTTASFSPRPRETRDDFRCLDTFVPRTSIVESNVGDAMYDHFAVHDGDADVAFGPVAVQMGLVRAEFEGVGSVRAVHEIQMPVRVDYNMVAQAIRDGLMSRVVSPYVLDDQLLAPDLRQLAVRSAAHLDKPHHLANVALAVTSWDSWDSTMRSMLPTRTWASATTPYVDFVVNCIPTGARYDVRLIDRTGTRHARVHASTDETAYHFVWSVSSASFGHAVVRAALHPSRQCVLVQVSTRETLVVRVREEDVPAALMG